jgi:ArsR family transcriptional regulator
MEKFIVMSLEDENSKKLAKVLSNDTSLKIMNKLAEKRHSPSELAKVLDMPLSTVQYNLDLLKESNMVKETAYRYSEKGKKISYYEPVKKLIIIAPESEKPSILNILKDKLLVPLSLVIASLVGFGLQPFFTGQQASQAIGTGASKAIEAGATAAPLQMPTNTAATLAATTNVTSGCTGMDPLSIFVLGSVITLVVLILLSYVKRKLGR